MSFTRPFLLGPMFFRTVLPCSIGHHQEKGGMPFHDAVGITSEKVITTENQGADIKYISCGVHLVIVCVI